MGCTCSSEPKKNQGIKSQTSRRSVEVNRDGVIAESNARSNAHEINNQHMPRNENRESNQQARRAVQNRQIVNLSQPSYEPYLESKNDPTFNMKETSTIIGEGIKRMPGFICEIEEEDLIKMKDDFWSSRFEGDPEVWSLIREICAFEYGSNTEVLLKDSGLTTYAGCINVLFDSKGNLYEIPNYCIHPPLRFEIPKLQIKKPESTQLSLVLRQGIESNHIIIQNDNLVFQLKEEYIKTVKQSAIKTIRLFYRGKEMKDKDFLFMHELHNESIVMVMICQI